MPHSRALLSAFAAGFLLIGCGGGSEQTEGEEAGQAVLTTAPNDASVDDVLAIPTSTADVLATRFVKLALGAGVHDGAFVDAYHGPQEWADEAAAEKRALDLLITDAETLLSEVEAAYADEPSARLNMLVKLVRAAHARLRMVSGVEFEFDRETELLYDVVAPEYDVNEFYAAIARIDELLPGTGPLHERVVAFRESVAVPKDKLKAVFDKAIDACREETIKRISLPDEERFELEFVSDKPWNGYNWFLGNYESLIQINTDLPIIVDRAIDLGCHEGYPGHHTWNVLLERDILREKGWIEYSIYPLFSPLSIVAEGSANYGIELAFPAEEKMQFERDVLFPVAGLDPENAQKLYELNLLRAKLSHARNHVARAYLDGKIDREEAVRMSMEFSLLSKERAEKSIDFIEAYRGYVVNYNIGLDLVTAYIDRRVAAGDDRWDVFTELLKNPVPASDIAADQ